MEFLAKAAAIAISVLASVFTNVQAPKVAEAEPSKARMTPVFYGPPAPQRPLERTFVLQNEGVTIVIVQPLEQVDPFNSAFEEWITSTPDPKAISSSKPWYMHDFFRRPTAEQASEVLRALISGQPTDF